MALQTSKFTPDSELELLFSPEIITNEVRRELHKDLHVCISLGS